jgi:hypothetical protein
MSKKQSLFTLFSSLGISTRDRQTPLQKRLLMTQLKIAQLHERFFLDLFCFSSLYLFPFHFKELMHAFATSTQSNR